MQEMPEKEAHYDKDEEYCNYQSYKPEYEMQINCGEINRHWVSKSLFPSGAKLCCLIITDVDRIHAAAFNHLPDKIRTKPIAEMTIIRHVED